MSECIYTCMCIFKHVCWFLCLHSSECISLHVSGFFCTCGHLCVCICVYTWVCLCLPVHLHRHMSAGLSPRVLGVTPLLGMTPLSDWGRSQCLRCSWAHANAEGSNTGFGLSRSRCLAQYESGQITQKPRGSSIVSSANSRQDTDLLGSLLDLSQALSGSSTPWQQEAPEGVLRHHRHALH